MRLILLMLALSTAAVGQTRWCNVTDFGKTLVYPPIARAAHVSGLVSLRVYYERSGKVTTIETIGGPVMLVNSATEQIKQAAIGTDAPGIEPCESLFILDYQLDDGKLPPIVPSPIVPGMFRGVIRAYVIVLSDPAATITRRRRWFNPF
jgi:hypothetical protein